MLSLEGFTVSFCEGLVENARRLEGFSLSFCDNLGENAQYKGFIFSFCECLMENAHFGRLQSQFLRMSHGQCSFWKASFSFFANVSWNTLVLKIVTFGESLLENIRFGSVDCRFLATVLWKTLLLEGKGKRMETETDKGKAREREEQRVCVFFLACCARGVRSTTWLLEGERARIYVPICCCAIWICVLIFFLGA